jgi:hypothetical protein
MDNESHRSIYDVRWQPVNYGAVGDEPPKPQPRHSGISTAAAVMMIAFIHGVTSLREAYTTLESYTETPVRPVSMGHILPSVIEGGCLLMLASLLLGYVIGAGVAELQRRPK